MRVLKLSVLLATLALAGTVFAEVPVIDAYDDIGSGSSSKPSSTQASAPAPASDAQASSAQPSGLDLSQAQPPAVSSLPLDQRITIVERQTSNLSQMLSQINSLQQQLQELRGQIETQNHNLQVLQDQVRTQYQDLEHRVGQGAASDAAKKSSASNSAVLNKVSQEKPAADDATKTSAADDTAATTKTDKVVSSRKEATDEAAATDADVAPKAKAKKVAVPKPVPTVPSNKEQGAYQAAFNLLKEKNYDGAATAFQDFLKQYPDSKNTVNGRYWLGQLYLLQGQPDKAISQFKAIVQNNSNGTKVPDAMVQLGLAYYAKGDLDQAKGQLAKVQKDFPDSPAAKLAKTRLHQIAKVDKDSTG